MEEKSEQEKRDLLLTEFILKVAVLEKVLTDKGLITKEDMSSAVSSIQDKLVDFLEAKVSYESAQLEQKD